jgi:hypothetical protein
MACGLGFFPFFNRDCEDKCKACACGCGACGCNSGSGCGCKKDDDKKVAIITAIRAVCAQGDGCFNNIGKW